MAEVEEQVLGEVWHQAQGKLQDCAHDLVDIRVWGQVEVSIESRVWAQIRGQAWDQMRRGTNG